MEYDKLLEHVKKISKAAGEKIYESFKLKINCNKPEASNKLYDKDIESYIIEELKKVLPQAGFYAEESGYINPENHEFLWIIDPLDGTTNYIHNIAFFSVSIALLYNNEVVLGVIYDPHNDTLFYGLKGKAAYCNNRRIFVSDTNLLSNAIIDMGVVTNQNLVDIYGKLRKRVKTARYLGSISLICAYIASGYLDAACFDDINWWDAAAGILLIKLAGGKVQNIDNSLTLLSVKQKIKFFIASNLLLHNELVDRITGEFEKNVKYSKL